LVWLRCLSFLVCVCLCDCVGGKACLVLFVGLFSRCVCVCVYGVKSCIVSFVFLFVYVCVCVCVCEGDDIACDVRGSIGLRKELCTYLFE
jgi:hypothetical protein